MPKSHELLCLAMTVLCVLPGVVLATVVEKKIQGYLSIGMKYKSNCRGWNVSLWGAEQGGKYAPWKSWHLELPWSLLGYSCFRIEVYLVNIQKMQIEIKKGHLQVQVGFLLYLLKTFIYKVVQYYLLSNPFRIMDFSGEQVLLFFPLPLLSSESWIHTTTHNKSLCLF